MAYTIRGGQLRSVASGRPVPSIEHDYLRDLVVRHVLDAGANRGQFSLWALDRFGSVDIDAFEPLDKPATTYERYLASPSVRLHRVALSDASGEASFHVSQADDSSSLLRIGTLQTELFPFTKLEETITVPVTTLDEVLDGRVLRRPSLLKIDVQGAELRLLRGGVATLLQTDYVFVELSFVELYEQQDLADAVVQFLDRSGFGLASVHNVMANRQHKPIQADFLFQRRPAR